MAITDTAHDSTVITRFFGLSTDTKPESAMIGATFYETDTRHSFVFDGLWRRDEQITVEQAAEIVVKDMFATNDLLGQMIAQQQITNAHLALFTEDELTEEDIDGSN